MPACVGCSDRPALLQEQDHGHSRAGGAIVAALAAWSARLYARRSDRSAAAAAAAAATTAALDMAAPDAELTPQFRITCEPGDGSPSLRLGVSLSGPPVLERLDVLTVTIRDDHPWRGQGTPLAGGPTPSRSPRRSGGPTASFPVPVPASIPSAASQAPTRPAAPHRRSGCPWARSCRSLSSRRTRRRGCSSHMRTGDANAGPWCGSGWNAAGWLGPMGSDL